MLRLFPEGTLFQIAVRRLEGLFSPERVFVVTVSEQAEQLMQQVPEVPAENYLIEPKPRGTASVVGLAAAALIERDPQAVMAVLTADHYIKNTAYFRDLLRAAHAFACDGYLMTLGIQPSFPSTGYGYIQRGEATGERDGQTGYLVRRFKEKPDLESAQAMLASGDHYWNSGMFVWRADRILAEFERQMPALFAGLERIRRAWQSHERQVVVEQVWNEIKSETIDYGIMEHAEQVAVLPGGDLGWSDVGSWDSLFDMLEGDAAGNIVLGGDLHAIDSENLLVSASDGAKLVVAIGLSDLIIVDMGDALLVCNRHDAQQVRNVVNHLKQNKTQYL
jgi:mannose-1-phosphate guanylyltransferase